MMNREYWDAGYKKKEETVSCRDIFYLLDKIKFEYLLTLLPSPLKGIKTIEVGCGAGRLSYFLASYGYETTCLDYSKYSLDLAKNNYDLTNNEGRFVLGDVKSLPFKNNSFDVVMSTGLLEHFTDPQIVVNEMVRILKPGCSFYSDIVPKKFSLLRSLDFLHNGQEEGNHFYEKKMSKQDIVNILQSARLEGILVFPAGVFPPSIPILERNSSVKEVIRKVLYKLKPLFMYIDNTILAEMLGFYYFAYAKKPKDI